jgi:hypothetical protein
MIAITRQRLEVGARRQWLGQILGQHVRDIDAEPVYPPVGPEPQRFHEVCAHLGAVPVQVGLLGGEIVQVPLAVGDPRPRRPTELR